MNISRLHTADADDFGERLSALLAWDMTTDAQVEAVAREILQDVGSRGDAALLELTARFDSLEVADVAELEISADELAVAESRVEAEQIQRCAAPRKEFVSIMSIRSRGPGRLSTSSAISWVRKSNRSAGRRLCAGRSCQPLPPAY